jgi:hypothetical protein
MTSPNVGAGHDRGTGGAAAAGRDAVARRLTTETKASYKTSELAIWALVTIGILVCAAAIKGGDNGTDEFIARHAWLYVSIVTAAYLVSRGLAKSGSREPYNDDGGSDRR